MVQALLVAGVTEIIVQGSVVPHIDYLIVLIVLIVELKAHQQKQCSIINIIQNNNIKFMVALGRE
ncbi:hypothetical protein BEI46_18495 [Aliivibrio fischeri]|nr:hypothetical protein BEI46_18495 [Aliivibrio fischeri]